MIKKLRIKFICYNMLIVVAMLTLLLGVLTEYMQKGLVKDQYAMLHRIAEDPERRFRPGTDEESFYPPHFILEKSRDGEFIVNGDGSFDLSNEEELKALYELVLSRQEKEGVAKEYDLRYIRMETPWGAKLVFTDMVGERATMRRLIRTSILTGAGGCGIIFIISLLLSRWAVKPVDEAWRQQKQFVSDASHELKTPLTVIMANAESLLNLARLDSLRETESLVAELDLSALVEDCILPFEPLYFERGLLLETELEPGIRVQGNEQVLRQCMDILLDNAQKYSDPGTVHVRLGRNGRQAELTVTNPSPELSREECRSIFKRFYRRDTARTAVGSYGLGLAIAEGIVERHRGKISCDWESGEIRFTILIPLL